jgi:hypothetical protein
MLKRRITGADPYRPLTEPRSATLSHGLNALSPTLRTRKPHLATLFAAISVVSTFALIELRHSSYVERLDTFVQEQTTSPEPANQPLEFPEFLGLGGDRPSIIVAVIGALCAALAIYFGARSWRTSTSSKLPQFLSRFSVVLGTFSLLFVGAISFGIA